MKNPFDFAFKKAEISLHSMGFYETLKISEKTYCAAKHVCLYSGSRFPKRERTA